MLTHTWQLAGKRAIDVLGAGLGLLLLSPLLLLLAALVRFTTPGPLFFVQQRSGLRGQLFPMIKFRTMTAGNHVVVGTETQARDPRITRVGQWLRRTGLDELPQLFNVLQGSMSLVGPRPLLAWENDLCNEREARRLWVKPGLTGLSQINGRNAIPWHARVEWDVRYVEQASLRLDLLILLKTVPTVLLGANAYAPPGCDIYAAEPEPQPPGEPNVAEDPVPATPVTPARTTARRRRLLFWQDEPYDFDGQHYWSEWTFAFFVEALARHTGPCTLAVPTERHTPPRGHRLDLQDVQLAPLPGWRTLREYLRLPRGRRAELRATARRLVGEHDAVFLRVPSLAARHFADEARRQHKPLIVFVCGDIRSAASPLRAHNPLVRLAARGLATYLHRAVRQQVRQAALVLAAGSALHDFCAQHNSRSYPVIMGLLPESAYCYRDDSYAGAGPVTLFRAARLTPNKGTTLLLDALRLLVDQGIDARLRLAGACSVPSHRADLQHHAQRLGVAARVEWLGHVAFGPPLFELYRTATVGVLTSWSEGFPRFIHEAWALALPVVTTPLAGISPPVVPDDNAVVTPTTSAADVAASVARIVRDTALRRRLIASGFAAAQANTLERASARVAAQLEQVC
jgi:lipopolysaccharide/colanic/teichoic acid biosynthesis glycosyltransferase/glycosyltransferase involved in cell wall biosynthesis